LIGNKDGLLVSFFPSGLARNYKSTLNHKISPLYQYIRDFSEHSAPLGAGEGIRVGLQNLFNNALEVDLLAAQLKMQSNHTILSL